MKRQIAYSLALAVLLSACNQDRGTSQPAPAAPPAPTADQKAPEPAKPATPDDAVLVDGIKPTFPHKLRSATAEPDADGAQKHRLNVEFIGVDGGAVADSLRQTFESSGYKVAGPVEKDGTSKFVALNGSGQRVDYVVTPAGPALKIKLTAPDAQGVVGFIWKDAKK